MDQKENTNRSSAVSSILPIVLAGLLITPGACRSDNSDAPKVVQRADHLAGSWYPGDRETLRRQLQGYLEKVTTASQPDTIALILPHAGYRFSGATAMAGAKVLAGQKYRRVVVMGPTHSVAMNNRLSVPGVTHYATPLGEAPLDRVFIDALKKHDIFETIPAAHQSEHSVQMEIPVLQQVLGNFNLVPIVVGSLDGETIRRAAAIIGGLVDADTLVVASSDFTHYGRRFNYVPFRDDIPGNIRKVDMGAYDFIAKCDADGFLNYHKQTGATICGRMPIAILLSMLNPDSKVQLLQYETSGDLTGDFQNSVSYLSVAFSGKWPGAAEVPAEKTDATLSDEDKKKLLRLARGSFTSYLKTGEVPSAELLEVEITGSLKLIRATFVTLEKDHRLRGCIGEIFPRQPLYQSVLANAIKSAVADRRFRPVTLSECPQLTVEISVLTPPEKVAGYKDIVIGKHGVVLRKDGRSAVYLPQVAPEQGWDVAETLTHLSRKAGLPGDAWKESAQFLTFEAIVFSEEDFADVPRAAPATTSPGNK